MFKSIPIPRLFEIVKLHDNGRDIILLPRKDARPCWNSRYGNKIGFKYLSTSGYYWSSLDGVNLPAHRVIWALHNGAWPDGQIDHINGDKSDNRIENLRVVTTSQNGMNRGKPSDNTSGYKGVVWDKSRSKWKATIGFRGKVHNIGRYDTKEDAIKAYEDKCIELHGEFMNLS